MKKCDPWIAFTKKPLTKDKLACPPWGTLTKHVCGMSTIVDTAKPLRKIFLKGFLYPFTNVYKRLQTLNLTYILLHLHILYILQKKGQ